jgi:hypothetical protein
MSNVEEIEAAIQELSPQQLQELRSWFAQFDAARWDKQIEEDASSGRLDEIAVQAISEQSS